MPLTVQGLCYVSKFKTLVQNKTSSLKDGHVINGAWTSSPQKKVQFPLCVLLSCCLTLLSDQNFPHQYFDPAYRHQNHKWDLCMKPKVTTTVSHFNRQ